MPQVGSAFRLERQIAAEPTRCPEQRRIIENPERLDILDVSVRHLKRHGGCVGTTKTPIEIDDEALAAAAEVLGTRTKKDTVNAALREVSARLRRLRALEALGDMADRGDFDEFIENPGAHRR